MKKIINLLLFLFTSLYISNISAQPQFPPDGEIYVKNVVPRVDIMIHPDSLAWIYENVESDHEFRAVFVFDNGTIHDTIQDIGFRLRGNTSRVSWKKSFKVSFNTFISGRKYYGVEKMNLNGEHNDPSVVRSRLYWDILRKSEIAGPRANHVQVYINGNYYGLYANIEHVDEEFAKTYFGNNNGNLYKCLYPADLRYLGSNPDLYKFTSGDHRTYELKTNEIADDYSDLAHFIDVLNNTPISQLACELEQVFNVQDYLKIAAIDILTANWDGYIYNKNNFYLYHNSATGLFEYIPYDTDNTFGIDWFNINWDTRSIYNWSNSNESRPLYTKLMQVPEYKAWFTYYIKQIINQITSTPDFLNSLPELQAQLDEYVANDPYYPLDYGYDINSFNTSFTDGTGAHVPIGIRPFILSRNSSAVSQAINTNAAPILKYITFNTPGTWQSMVVSSYAEDANLNSVSLEYRINGGAWQQTPMHDDGQNGDLMADDRIYTLSLTGMEGNTLIEFSIKATDNSQLTTIRPCSPIQYTIPSGNVYNLYINEFMASNSSTITDENGEYDDWIELYNAGNSTIWLGDKYLTDNLSSPVKWALPDTTIAPGSFMLVWADGQPEQGQMHTNYKLDKDGEEIGLFDNEASGYTLLDAVTYELQSTDISMGRITDASVDWKFFNIPTPESTNSLVGIDVNTPTSDRIWPTPVNSGTIFISEKMNFSIYDMQGRRLLQFRDCRQADVSSLTNGIYILISDPLSNREYFSSKFIIAK